MSQDADQFFFGCFVFKLTAGADTFDVAFEPFDRSGIVSEIGFAERAKLFDHHLGVGLDLFYHGSEVSVPNLV